MPDEKAFTIAVVDDGEISRRVIVSELSQDPAISISDFADPLRFLENLETLKPDMLISDLIMPAIDGYQLCHAVRSHPAFGKIPIILLSAMIDQTVREKALQNGVTETLRKPFKPFELSKLVTAYTNSLRHAYQGSVLLVDDSAMMRRIIAKILHLLNIRVYEAKTLAEAKTLLKQTPIGLILLDHLLPDGTGIDWCRELKSHSEYEHLPILGISSDDAISLSFIEAGADDYVGKLTSENLHILERELTVRVQNLLKRALLHQKLEETLIKEKTLNEQKNKLLGMAAHDLRNPIAIIRGNTENMVDGILDREEQKTALQIILKISDHMLNLLNDMLDMSAIESGAVELELTPLHLDQLVQERLQFMNLIGKAKNIQGTLINRLPSGSSSFITGDALRLSQVLDNLMSNAVKYSEPGNGYEVFLSHEVEGFVVEIRDQGKGIPEDELPGLFNAFKKTSVKATAGEKSTGLGLAIVKKIIDLHHGRVWVKSAPLKGSSFFFLLPEG